MEIDTGSWLKAALNAESSEFANMIRGLPSSSLQDTAALLADSGALDSRVYALRSVSQDISVGGDPALAVALATVGIQFCEHAFELYGPGTANTFLFGVEQFSIDAHRAYDRMGCNQEQLDVVENALTWLVSNHADEQRLTDLRFARIEALIELGQLEQAREGLNNESDSGYSGHHLFGFLKERLDKRLTPATAPLESRSIEEQTADQRQQTLKLAVKGLSSIAPEFAGLLNGLTNQIDNERELLSPSESIAKDSHMYQKLGSFLETMAVGEGNQIRLNTTIHRVSAVLADPTRGHVPAEIQQARVSLEETRQEALNIGLDETAIDTLWPLYICYKRLELPDEALKSLQAIRQWVNARRILIKDPLKRAGVTNQYPHLYLELANQLMNHGDSAELLSVIEESKGRALTDTLETKSHRDDILVATDSAANWLPELMTSLDSHYLTFLLDDAASFAVCVTKMGSIHSARLPIGSNLLNKLRSDLPPSGWGKKAKGFIRNPTDIPQQLSPLLNWLEDLFEQQIIRQGDHICYSPDNLMHLVPLHYVAFRGEPIVKAVSLSRTHCATLLRNFMLRKNSSPTHSITVTVPLANEVVNNPEKVKQLKKVSRWLDDIALPNEPLESQKADLSTVARHNLTHAVVHFATHGIFPVPERRIDPYGGSGILLSKSGALPLDEKTCELLSPERIIEQGSTFNFDCSHVSLQACVSGLSEMGAGGDALGLEWSMLMAGASSVLSTHWDIPVGSSAQFCIRFYDDWLFNGCSKAQAWRNAVLSLIDEQQIFEGDQVYRWAAFSLAGDWR